MRRAFLLLAVLLLVPHRASADDNADLLRAARAFFDPEKDIWRTKKEMKEAMEESARGGADLMKDVSALSNVLYQGRSFREPFSDTRWQAENDIRRFDENGPYRSLFSARLRFTFALPETYPKPEALAKLPRPGPLPLLFSLHERSDYEADPAWHPGAAALGRRYPKTEFGGLYKGWLMFAPVAPQAGFTEDGTGAIRPDFTTVRLAEFWRRYHVDFDRIFLDGADAAIALASAQPNYFSGIVLWGGNPDAASVRNFGPLPLYVVEDETLWNLLVIAGHEHVILGPASGIPAWLASCPPRAQPTKFHWTMARQDQAQAWWISILAADTTPGAERTLDVEVKRADNRIEIAARGIQEISIYLNDTIVDLDREVEIVVNGTSVLRKKLAREFDDLLPTKSPIQIQRSLYLGWLFPTVVPRLAVPSEGGTGREGADGRDPSAAGAGSPPAAGAGEDEQKAVIYWTKALEKEAAGDDEGARALWRRILALGPNSFRAAAEARLAGQPAPARPAPAEPAPVADSRLENAIQWFLAGRPDRLEGFLGTPEDASALWPLGFRDTWWRGSPDGEALERYRAAELRSTGAWRDLWTATLEGPATALPAEGTSAPPMLLALATDRRDREERGLAAVVGGNGALESAARGTPYDETVRIFAEEIRDVAYAGPEPDPESDASKLFDRVQPRGPIVAIFALILFVGSAWVVGRRAGRTPPKGT